MSFSKKILKEKNKTQTTKSNTINKSNNIFIFIIGIILFLILLYYLTYLYYENINKKNISKFEDTTTTTTMMNCIKEPEPPKPTKSVEELSKEAEKAAYGAAGPPNKTKGNTCSLPYDIPSVCINYEACCSSISQTNKCFCEHPSVLSCKSTYDNCINNANTTDFTDKSKELADKCNSDREECCVSHNKIPIDSNNFNSPTNQSQLDNILCNVRSIKNIETKCLELCQTNKDCTAYSTSPYTCILFSKVTPYIPKKDSDGKPSENTSISFYIKK